MAIPNEYQFVVETANKYPREFREAHTGGPNTELWIRLLAWELHSKRDPRWGLNGKRGDKNVISQDCVAWKGEGVGSDAHDNLRPMTVVDVIEGAGGNNPKPRWGVFNNPQTDSAPGGATWIMPRPIPGYHDSLTPSPVVPPMPSVELNENVINLLQAMNQNLAVITEAVNRVASKNDEEVSELRRQHERLAEMNQQLQVLVNAEPTKTNEALIAELVKLNSVLSGGFSIKGKAGWPVGNVDGTVTPRAQD